MTDEPTTTPDDLAEEHGATEEDPGQRMAQDASDQHEAALDPEETVNDRLDPQEPDEALTRAENPNPDLNTDGYPHAAPGEMTRGTFIVIDAAGEEQEIARKEDRGGGLIVMVSVEGAEFVPHPSGGVQQYNPDIHGTGGTLTEETAGTEETEAGDPPGPADLSEKTEAALAAEAGDEARGIDRTGDTDLPSPDGAEAPKEEGEEPSEVMGGADGPLPPEEPEANTPEATDAAVELAAEKGVDLSEVEGTGVDGKVTKPDVEAALENDEAEG